VKDVAPLPVTSAVAARSIILRTGFWLPVVLVVAVGIVPFITGSATLRESLFLLLMFVTLASSLNLMLGFTGYVSFGHIVFFGIGGYVGFWCISVLNSPLILAAIAGALAAGALALVLGASILRLRGAYFALATIGINEATRAFVSNFGPFGGPTGMSLDFSIYRQYGGPGNVLWLAYGSMLGLALLVIVLSYGVKASKFGLALFSIREDEDAAMVMGVRTPRAKTVALVLSSIVPGMVGVLFFFKNGNVEPADAFRLQSSIEIIVMVMLGGFGTVLGPVIGAAGYEQLRGFLLTSDPFKSLQLTIAGFVLLLVILFVPSGIVGWLRARLPRLRSVLE
jgi:branched-chain amino acid transport system permease protein